jgi:hypothetical protein
VPNVFALNDSAPCRIRHGLGTGHRSLKVLGAQFEALMIIQGAVRNQDMVDEPCEAVPPVISLDLRLPGCIQADEPCDQDGNVHNAAHSFKDRERANLSAYGDDVAIAE